MGANNHIFNRQIGDRQLKILCAMYEGAKLFESFFLQERKRNIVLNFNNPNEEKLKQREVQRLLKKGCIKIHSIKIMQVGVFYEYKLTNDIKTKLSHYEN